MLGKLTYKYVMNKNQHVGDLVPQSIQWIIHFLAFVSSLFIQMQLKIGSGKYLITYL